MAARMLAAFSGNVEMKLFAHGSGITDQCRKANVFGMILDSGDGGFSGVHQFRHLLLGQAGFETRLF